MSTQPTSTPRTPLRIGVLFENVQLSDIIGIDVLGSLTPEYLETCLQIMPQLSYLAPLTTPIEFLYISSTLEPTFTTPSVYIKPTHTYASAPTDLDIILVGGPDPMGVKEESLAYLKEASIKTKCIMTTCTGGIWLARAGVLDGKKGTTNRGALEIARKVTPEVDWVDQRWVVEEGWFEGAEIWTAGGAGCGVDMIIEYALKRFDDTLVRVCCQGLEWEIEGRSQFYKAPLTAVGVKQA